MKPLILVCASLLAVSTTWGQALPKKDTANPAKPVTEDFSKVFTKVDVPSDFPGGPDGWRKYLEQNLKYPNKAQRKGIQGLVKVQFIVDRTGKVSQVMALNDPGGGLADEAVRVIAEGPNWKPATQSGRKVTYRHVQNITFMLE